MNSIIYIGMEVHNESYTICSYDFESDSVKYQQKIPSDYILIFKYVDNIRNKYGSTYDVICGYEADCLGYSLYHNLTNLGHKSVVLKKRQSGNGAEVIAYADKANEHLRRKYYKMTLGRGVNGNIAKTAIARELACFIWGMMTEHIG